MTDKFARDLNAYVEKRKKEVAESHSGMQRRKSMTQEERGREAVDYFTGEIKSHAEKLGGQMTESEARKQAVDLANRAERKQGR